MDTERARSAVEQWRMRLLRVALCVALALVTALSLTFGLYQSVGQALASACTTKVETFVAHEDDDLLFTSPDLLHSMQSSTSTVCVRTVYLTAGDAGSGQSYWGQRELGTQAAYAQMLGAANAWTQSDAGVTGHPIPVFTLNGNPNVSLVYMRLPDGNVDGSGFSSTGHKSLQKLWSGSASSISAVNGSSSYTKTSLIATLLTLMQSYQPTQIRTQDYIGTFGDGDHSDHHATAYFARAAHQQYTTPHTFTGYMDYASENQPANVSGSDLTGKSNAFYAYTPFDILVCQSPSDCSNTDYAKWLQRQYIVGSESGGTGGNHAPIANAGSNQTVASGASVQLDGSGSSDPDGNPITYAWSQTGGPSVTLSSTTAVKPTFTAPTGPATLTFQLVVNDGQVNSAPSSVAITVNAPASNNPPVANAGPNQTVASGASVQLNGSGSSDPDGNPITYAWSQTAGPAVTLSSTTVAMPTFTAPTGPATLTFQLVVNDGHVNSSPSSVTITVNAPSTNNPPIANAGANQTVASGASVQLDGSGSSDPDGNPITYAWSQTAGPTVTLSSTTAVKPTFTAPTGPATLTFQLVVNDGLVNSSPSSVTITVNAPVSNNPPVANAGANQLVASRVKVELDGSGSSDPDGNTLTYAWSQTAGPTVTLSTTTGVQPTFTAPTGPTTLTFQLVVNDGQVNSSPSSVTITVSASGAINLALSATATASSQNAADGQTAAKAIDGVVDGYPGNYTKEWATVGGGAGSWLKLTWANPVTFNQVMLYDRPNLDDQITGATLTFSDGSTVSVGTLPNNGTALPVTFPTETTSSVLLTINAVSASTNDIGLSEIQVWGM